ncbi:MAG: GFA family protein [Solirubrobacteraceae bacterium]
MATGRCLCGAVRYEVRGPLRDVLICHCQECRRWHGHVSAFTAARREYLAVDDERAVRWTDSPAGDAHARRGFCGECGSSLFWDAPGRETVSIAAGTLDGDTGLRVAGHIYVSERADYDDLPGDGLPRHDRGGAR